MIDANTLLNPEFQDSELRAYAYLSTQFKKGVRSPLDCLQPFVVYAIAAQDGSQLIWDDLRVFLKDRYGLRIPFYMLQRMEGSLLALGAVEKTEIPRVLICKDVRPKIASKSVDFSVQEIGHAEIALEKFAQTRGVPKPQTAASWRDILVPFFLHRAPPQDKAVSNINGVMVSDPKGFDFSLVADFIVEEFHKKSPIYKVIEQIYYGALISDFLTQMEQAGSGAEFKGLGIIYDAPVILRMLGCSGKVLKEATLELHETLRDLGCRVYYFSHTYDETSEAIEAMLKCYENKQPMFRETQEAISRGEITIAELYQIRAEFDIRLSSGLGLTQHAGGYGGREADDYQINETAFKEFLKKRTWGREGSHAADRDVQSLSLIVRLRSGKQVRDVAKSKFLFVTHNVKLTFLARDFLRDEGQLEDGSVWPFLSVGQISTISWVASESFDDEKRVSKELIANCYSAALPDQDFDERLKEALVQANPQTAHDVFQNAFVTQSVRQAALSQTMGYSALLSKLNTSELLAQAAVAREEAISHAKAEERKVVSTELAESLKSRQINIAEQVAKIAATIIVTFAVLICGAAMLRDLGVFGQNGEHRGFILISILAVAAIYGLLDLSGLLPAASTRAALRNMIFKITRYIQLCLT